MVHSRALIKVLVFVTFSAQKPDQAEMDGWMDGWMDGY